MKEIAIERFEKVDAQISYVRGMLDLALDNICSSGKQIEESAVESLFGIKQLLDYMVEEHRAWLNGAARQ